MQKGITLKVEGKTLFHFDEVFDEDTKTPLVYKSIARGMVKSVLCESYCVICFVSFGCIRLMIHVTSFSW